MKSSVLGSELPARQEGRHVGGGSRRLGHRLGDVLGLAERAGHKYPRLARPGRVVAAGHGKAVLVQADPQLPGQRLHPLRRGKAQRQHHQVELLVPQRPILTHVGDGQVLRPLRLVHHRRHRPPVGDPRQRLDLGHVLLEPLAKGPQVHKEDGRLQPRVQLLGQRHLLGGVQAAGRRAVPRPT